MMYPWYQAHWQALLLLQAALGTWVFAYGLKRRPHFVGRAAFSLMMGAFLAEGTTRLLWHFSGWAQLLTVSLIYGLLILVGFICFEESIWTVMFVASSGYMLQDIASNIKQLLRLWSWVNGFMQTNVGLICIDALCYGGCCLLAHRVFRHETDRVEVEFNDKLKVAFSVGVLLICACLSRLSRIAPALIHGDLGCGHRMVICMYQVVLGAFMLLLQYGVMERTRLDRYVDTMQELLHQQHAQYETSKENAELVSEKYHDFKKMIEGLRKNHVNEKALDKLDAVLLEVPKVRKDLGYPPLVTPMSQMVGVQATVNVLTGGRYKNVSKEIKAYVKGEYGRAPGKIDPEVQKLVLGDEKPITQRYADLLEPGFEKAKRELGERAHSDEDVLSYIAFPAQAEAYFEKRDRKEDDNEIHFSIREVK